MPKVVTKSGKVKHFPYTPAGKKAAKDFAKKTDGKMTDEQDDAYDKKHGIKEGSKKDMSLDKKRGVPEDDKKKKVKVVIVAPKKVMKNKMPLPIPVPMPVSPVKKVGKLKNPSIYR